MFVLQSTEIGNYVRRSGGHFRQTDDDSPLPYEDPRWADVIKRPRTSLPWIIVSNDKTWYEGKLPNNIDETLQLIEKHVPR